MAAYSKAPLFCCCYATCQLARQPKAAVCLEYCCVTCLGAQPHCVTSKGIIPLLNQCRLCGIDSSLPMIFCLKILWPIKPLRSTLKRKHYHYSRYRESCEGCNYISCCAVMNCGNRDGSAERWSLT